MSRRTKVLTIAISLAVVSLLTIGGVALADDSRNCEKPFGPRMGKMAACGQMGAFGPNGMLSEVLDLTPEEIKAELQAGKTIIEIAAEQGFTNDQLKEAINAAMAAKLQQQVADGTITQEQADKMLQRMQDGPAKNGQPKFGFGLRGHGGFPGVGAPCAPVE